MAGVPGAECLHQLFEAQVDLRPLATALIENDVRLSYKELEDRSNQLAHYLRACDIGPEDIVGLYMRRSANLFVALLATLKAGAAYLPLDLSSPPERIEHMLQDANVALLLSERPLMDQAQFTSARATFLLDTQAEQLADVATSRLSSVEKAANSDSLCYVIYTSGTTGRPKGVLIEHRNAVNFVRAVNEVYQIDHTDRIYQGFSLAFDAAVEETWMAFATGAPLILCADEIARSPAEIAHFLTEQKITFFSTVPSFLSLIEKPLPTVRLLILGGEPCPPELVARWAKPDCRLLNTYGPTETAVVATWSECHPDREVTIGRPLNGYDAHVLDLNMKPVAPGEPGELFIGGKGVARGYLNRPELNASRFVMDPSAINGSRSRLYRTGDKVSVTASGELKFLGRIDNQIKIRGYRVELSEIEQVLLEHPDVLATAVKVVKRDGLQAIAAYVVPKKEMSGVNIDSLITLVEARLPSYMMPDYLEILAELPTSLSGKLDRTRLPEPVTPLVRQGRQIVPAQNECEQKLLTLWEELFQISPISVEDDFFSHLGGHSLKAARLVSRLRSRLGLTALSVSDIYRQPTIRQLARELERHAQENEAAASNEQPTRAESHQMKSQQISGRERWRCYLLQAVSLFGIYIFLTLPISAILILFFQYHRDEIALSAFVINSMLIGLLFYPVLLGFSIALKWIVIGRYKPGRYPLWGTYYFRWWLVDRIHSMSGAEFLTGTPLMGLYYRLMGAKIGRNCLFDTAHISIFDLVSIGDETSIGAESHLLGYRVENSTLVIAPIDIGSRCFVGIHTAVGLNTQIGDDARLGDMSFLSDQETIAAGGSWEGSPARPSDFHIPAGCANQSSRRRWFLFTFLHIVVLYLAFAFILLTWLPTFSLITFALLNVGIWAGLASILLAVPLWVVTYCLAVGAIKRLVLGRVRPGTYQVESFFYLRKWFVDFLLQSSRRLLLPLYATLYLPIWLRLLGAKIGPRSEISTVSKISPELLEVEGESFFADGAIIGGMRIYRGQVELAKNQIGRRTFVGNSAFVPSGHHLGNECLLGCLSAAPAASKSAPDGSSWVGSPAFQLPERQQITDFDNCFTYQPTKKLVGQRLIMDSLRILIPFTLTMTGMVSFVLWLFVISDHLSAGLTLILSPFLTIVIAAGVGLSVIGVKRILVGVYQPTMQPLWSFFVWQNEIVNATYEFIAAPLLNPLLGTPFISLFLRRLGCKIGRSAYIGTTLFSEFDLVEIGDYAALNTGATIQTHLFEDRVMKADNLRIGNECTVGNMAVVLYDTNMQTGSSLDSLSLLMKGETLPNFSCWQGIPTQPREPNLVTYGNASSPL